MHANKTSPPETKSVAGDDIAVDLYPFIRQYNDGRIERLQRSSFVPASEDAAANRGVATRDSNYPIDIEGLIMVHPYFWSSQRLASEAVWDGVSMFAPENVDRLWPFVTAGQAGNDDPRINPPEDEIASLACRRVLVAVAEKDSLRDRGRRLAAQMRDWSWAAGENVTLVESEGEDHGFHLYNPLRATSKKLMESIVQFVDQRSTALPLPAALLPSPHELRAAAEMDSAGPVLGVPTRPYMDIFGYGMAMKAWSGSGPSSMTRTTSLQIGQGKKPETRYGLSLGRVRPTKANMVSLSAKAHWSSVIKNFF
ncbi:probable carboxylesterase 2 [Brachypodium distachyon]|uniref:probable carboxylesterase 2 n=1 Tax=Brachypodium distachyon TaxID=15368 RepID=UPI000234EC69|nr:probable carboxylesterase 2 [Brachypodium distachyon]|eukprot:XP_003560136.1 probable carboxylesterase 2 [Brachypodium distachyon]